MRGLAEKLAIGELLPPGENETLMVRSALTTMSCNSTESVRPEARLGPNSMSYVPGSTTIS